MSLKELRLKCQITQQDLSKAISVNRSTYAMWESGSVKPPLSKINLLAGALNVSVAEIIACFIPSELTFKSKEELVERLKEAEETLNED